MIRMLKDDVEYGVTYESIKNYKYSSHRLNPMQNTIGNFIILPMELAHCRETYKPIRTHMRNSSADWRDVSAAMDATNMTEKSGTRRSRSYALTA